jgi:CubicO group peptidase (beta-lactamase class C family)
MFLALALTQVAGAAVPGPALRALLEDAHRRGVFNGMALVAQHGHVLIEMPLGSATADGSPVLTVHDRFNIGSVSKEFSATILMRLAQSGQLAVSDSVSKYLHDLPGWSRQVTVRMLLDYSSGLPEMRWRAIHSDQDAYQDLRDLEQTTFAPGTAFAYTYDNIMMRQFVIAAVTGRPFDDALRTLFLRCGLRESVVNPPADARRIARSYSDEHVADPMDFPVSGIAFVTAADLYRWMRCLHSGGVLNHASMAVLGHGINPDNGALGKVRWSGSKIILHEHQGESRNYEALVRFDAARDSYVVLLANNKQQHLGEIADALEGALDDWNRAAAK